MTEITREQTLDLYNMLYDDNQTLKDYKDLNDEEFFNEFGELFDEITDKGYDGYYDYQSMYWFLKGLKISEPTRNKTKPPKINESKPFNVSDVHLKPLPPKLKPEDVKITPYIKSTDYIKRNDKKVMEKIKNMKRKQPHTYEEAYEEQRRQFMKPYEEYKEELKQQNENVNKLAEELGKKLNASNNEWFIDFEQFDNNGRKQLFPILKNWLHNKLDVLPMTNHYKFHFKVNGRWHTRAFSQELYNKLVETFTKGCLIYNMDDYAPENDFFSGGSDDALPAWSLISAIHIEKMAEFKNVRDDIGGHFFKYLVDPSVPEVIKKYLERLQIFETLSFNGKSARKELNDCCLIYTLMQTGAFGEPELNLMRMDIKSRYISQGNVKKLCEKFKIKLFITRIKEDAEGKNKRRTVINHGKNFIGFEYAIPERTFRIAIYEDHYFIEEKTPFTSSYIENIDTAPTDAFNKTYKKVRGVHKWIKDNEPKRFISSSDLVRSLMEQNKFIPINYATASILSSTLYDQVKDGDFPLEIIDPEKVFKLIAPKVPKEEEKDEVLNFWYSDFEADTSGKVHVPFMNVTQSSDGKINKVFKGPNCAKEFLDFLPDNAVCYFHNLAYDWCMFNREVTKVNKVIRKGTKVYQAHVIYHGKNLTFKDSLPIFMCPLSVLPSSFGLTDIKKELFPYNYYTLERLKENKGIINEAGKNEVKNWSSEDYDTFIENIDSIPGCRLSPSTFDMYKYAEFYCEQDVRILRLSFEKLADGFMTEFNIDVKKILTTPALANEFFNQNVYFPNGNLFMVGGHVREFLSHAIYGGRCMCAFNKKWHTDKPLYDYDAVSLYPSAMYRLWTVEGTPEVLNVEDSEKIFSSIPNYLEKYNSKDGIGAYVIEIKITKVNKHYAFPLIAQHTKEGNLYNDILTEPVIMTVDNILLEDLIEFQKIEFQVIKGYVWNGKRDYKIQEVIKTVFNKRLEYKKQNNPLQLLYKLIMNSSYGKTIQKPIENDLKFLTKHKRKDKKGNPKPSELEAYWQKNYNKIIEEIEINDDVSVVKVKKQIDEHFNFSLLGIQVLSMSKRIMNEVMCLGFDLGCHIYYQDTDSMHIEADDLPKLEEAFEKKYNRPLRGSNLGQFHSDFPTINGHKEMPKAIESYFIMKKCYIDKLQDSTGQIDYMIRGKGLTQNSICHAGKLHGGLMNLYKSLYEGNTETFDLTVGQPMFNMKSDFTVETKKVFIRRTKTTYEEGNRENYFN